MIICIKEGAIIRYNVKSTLILAMAVLVAALANLVYSVMKSMPIGDAVILICISVVVFLVDFALCRKQDNIKK